MVLQDCCKSETMAVEDMIKMGIGGGCPVEPLLCQGPESTGGKAYVACDYQEDDQEWRNTARVPEAYHYGSGMNYQFTQDRLLSLVAFASAPLVERCCLFAIAQNTCMEDLEQFRTVFREVDRDGDGLVSRRDLAWAMDRATILKLPMDEEMLFQSVDLNRDGVVDFREFVAACLHTSLAPLDVWLADQAFRAMDHDSDGYLVRGDTHQAFKLLPAGLPYDRKFDIHAWRSCVLRDVGQINPYGEPASQTSYLSKVPREPSLDFFSRFFSGCQNSNYDDNFDEINFEENAKKSFSAPQAPAAYMPVPGVGPPGQHGRMKNRGFSSPAYVPRA